MVQMEDQGLQGQLGNQARLVGTVGTAEKVPRDLEDLRDPEDKLARLEVQDRRVLLDLRGRRDQKDRGCQV